MKTVVAPIRMPSRRAVLASALTLGAAAVLAACGGGGGSDDAGGGSSDGLFMRARINGQVVSFSTLPVAALYTHRSTPDGLLVAGAIQGGNGYPSMSIQILDNRAIAPGTYAENSDTTFFRYSPREDEHYVSTLGPERDFRITITSMSGDVMRGSFAGTVRDEATEGRTTVWSVTDGSFALQILRP